jgi:ABC-type Fe3+/spermidine/putrescine transport system ATPase subunit
VIDVRGVTKRFKDTLAVDSLSFEVPTGVVTGFLGPNGSGKSTTMRLIMGLDHADVGEAVINGVPYHRLAQPLREVGALLDAKAFHPARTARNHLRCLALSHDSGLAVGPRHEGEGEPHGAVGHIGFMRGARCGEGIAGNDRLAHAHQLRVRMVRDVVEHDTAQRMGCVGWHGRHPARLLRLDGSGWESERPQDGIGSAASRV